MTTKATATPAAEPEKAPEPRHLDAAGRLEREAYTQGAFLSFIRQADIQEVNLIYEILAEYNSQSSPREFAEMVVHLGTEFLRDEEVPVPVSATPERGLLTCEHLMEMSESDRRYLGDCATIVEHHTGTTSPAEEFILNLVTLHVFRGITPDDVAPELDGFRADFRDAVGVARMMTRKYPASCAVKNKAVA